MVWAAPALAAATLCLRVSTDLLKATAAVLILGAALSSAEHPRGHFHDVYNLGEPVCELELATIPASDPDILEKLKLCPALTGAQRDALNALLLSGATAYGDPSSWDLQTLQDLGPLVLALNQTMLGLVGKAAREDFRSSIAAAYLSQGRSQRGKSLILLRALAAASAAARPRLKHSSGRCESKLVTASNIEDIPYISAEELDLCLSSEVLIENLEAVLELPVTTESLRVLKKKVDEVYPSGIPEEQLRHLGQLSHLYTEQEISQWPVTSNDTLTALLSSSGELWEDSQVQQLFKRYLALGGSWTGPLLQEIGGEFLCKLQEEQIQQIPSGAIGTAGQLNISSCSQTKKELLYGKAREAFASLASTPGPYYCRIRPYLGGAPAEDLKDLANAGVTNMDQDTFLALNPQEFQKLSVTDVKNLLGKNLPELKKAEHEPWVVSWVQRQFQRELDCVLGIGLEGGLPDPTGTSPATATSSVTTPTTATFSVTATIPVPTTPVTATSTVTATTPVPTTPASVTSIATVPTSPHPVTSANVTSVPTTLPTVPVTSASATTLPPIPSATSASGTSMATNPVPTTLLTVPTTSAISSHSTPQPSTVPPRTPTLSTLSPPDTPTHTARPPVPPATGPVPTATPAPCSTHQAVTRDRATSPAVTSPAVPSLATSSPSATPVPAVTSGAITSTGVGTNLAGTTHSTVPNPTSPPTVTTVPCPSSTLTITTVPSSAPTVTPVSHSSSAATATHSTVTPVPNSTSAPTVTSVPNPTSSPTATHSTATTVSNSTSPTVTSVPKPSSSPSVSPISQSPPAPGPSTVPAPSPSPIPSSTVPTPAVPCQPGSPPAPPSTSPSPGNVPESPAPSPNGYINLQPPEPGSGSRLCSCLVPMLAATVGRILLL